MGDRFTVPIGPTAPQLARREVARRAAEYEITDGPLDDAILVVSEVVTNVVRHSDAREGEQVTITVDRGDHGLRISVEQPSALPTLAPSYEPTADGGMGLAIIEKITAAWGIDPGPPGRVWFELPATSTQ